MCRLIWHDRNLLLILVNSLTLFLYLPALPVLVVAIRSRRFLKSVFAGILVVFQIFFTAHSFAFNGSAKETGEDNLCIVSANLFYENVQATHLIEELLAYNADLLLLQEYTPAWDSLFKSRSSYPYVLKSPRSDPRGRAIFSKYPLAEDETLKRVDIMGARVNMRDRCFDILNVHFYPPGFVYYEEHVEQRNLLLGQLDAFKSKDMIIAGDFNATEHSGFYNEMASVFVDSFKEAGRGFGATWPNFAGLSFIRIDHLFHSDRFECIRIDRGEGRGSDHRPVIAEFTLKNSLKE